MDITTDLQQALIRQQEEISKLTGDTPSSINATKMSFEEAFNLVFLGNNEYQTPTNPSR